MKKIIVIILVLVSILGVAFIPNIMNIYAKVMLNHEYNDPFNVNIKFVKADPVKQKANELAGYFGRQPFDDFSSKGGGFKVSNNGQPIEKLTIIINPRKERYETAKTWLSPLSLSSGEFVYDLHERVNKGGLIEVLRLDFSSSESPDSLLEEEDIRRIRVIGRIEYTGFQAFYVKDFEVRSQSKKICEIK